MLYIGAHHPHITLREVEFKSLTRRRFCYSEEEPILSLLTAIVIIKSLWQIRSSNTIFQSII